MESIVWMFGGSELQRWGAEGLKVLLSMVLRRVGGTVRWMEQHLRGREEEVNEIGRCEVVDGLESKQDSKCDREPVELLKNSVDVMKTY